MIESVSWGMGTPTESFPGRSASHRPAWCLSTQRLTSCFTERSRFFLFLFCSSTFFFCIFPYFSACLFFSVCVCGGFILTWKESQTETRTGSLKKRKRKEKGENSNSFPKRKETMEARPHFQTGPGRWKFAWKKAAWSRISQLLIKRWSLVSRELPSVFFSVIFF